MFENSKGFDSPNRKSGPLFIINPGGLAGYLAAVTGNISFVTITARTDTTVGFMHKKVLDKYIESYPNILLCLSKRLVNQLPPLVFHIDVALEWGQMNAGQILCKQGDPSHSIFIVLTGRLRSISQNQDGKMELVGEYGNSESVGEMEVLMDSRRSSTIHAIRDTEVAILPKTLFNILAIQHPEIMLTIARLIAVKSQDSNIQKTSLTRGIDNVNLKTICILPLHENVPILKFSEFLKESLESLGASVSALYNSTVMNHLGKHAFTKFGRLRLLSWLAEQEESHRLVLYIADSGIKNPWSQRCIRQADCLILVAIGDGDGSLGENDRLLTTGMKTTARKELVLLHPTRSVTPGSTSKWLKPRPWF
jgi:lysophospholipid hydrolase